MKTKLIELIRFSGVLALSVFGQFVLAQNSYSYRVPEQSLFKDNSWSFITNPSVAMDHKWCTSFSYQQSGVGGVLRSPAFYGRYRFKKTTFGTSYTTAGYEVSHWQRISLGLTQQLGKTLSSGITLKHALFKTRGYESINRGMNGDFAVCLERRIRTYTVVIRNFIPSSIVLNQSQLIVGIQQQLSSGISFEAHLISTISRLNLRLLVLRQFSDQVRLSVGFESSNAWAFFSCTIRLKQKINLNGRTDFDHQNGWMSGCALEWFK